MVKFGKNKFKALNKVTKKLNSLPLNVSNKVLKKKINAEKKVTFQKEALLKETAKSETLVKKVSPTDIALKNVFKKPKTEAKSLENESKIPKQKGVEKQKKRQKTQISDTKLLLNLMKKKS